VRNVRLRALEDMESGDLEVYRYDSLLRGLDWMLVEGQMNGLDDINPASVIFNQEPDYVN
jgi:hypothetical protein